MFLTRIAILRWAAAPLLGVFLLAAGIQARGQASGHIAGTVVSWKKQMIPYVPPGTRFQAISGGWWHSLGLRQDGTVVAWGENDMNQATPPSGLIGIVDVAAGGFHNLALRQNGTITAWGDNSYGQVSLPVGLSGVTAIAAGGYHSLALKQDGTVVAWGQIWGGSSYQPATVPSGLSNVVAIAARDNHSLALRSDGTVVAWGNNEYGQNDAPSFLSGVTAVAAGGRHSLALKQDGTVVAWGDDSQGQSTIPTWLSDVVAIAAGGGHSLALKQDGTVVAWGNNSYGQTNIPNGLTGVMAISAGGNHSLALKQDGTVVTWGANQWGQALAPGSLGDVTTITAKWYHSLALKQDGTVVTWGYNDYGQGTLPSALSKVIAIAAGARHSLAVKQDTTVSAWGDNSFGQTSVPKGLSGVIKVAGGALHSVALKQDGTVVAWGGNYAGQTNVPLGLNGVVAIAAGADHNLVLKQDGTVVAWGDNSAGQSTVPVSLSGVVAIAAGSYYSLALRENGMVVAWGDNSSGQTTVPPGLSGVVAIVAGVGHSLALRQDGTVVAWGFNGYGQTVVPSGISGVVAVAGGEEFSLALVVAPGGNGAPSIIGQPQSQNLQAGANVMLTAAATGTSPLTYQWRKNGVDIPGANGSTLILNSVTASDSDAYSVRVWNAYGSIVSDAAYLAVLTDGANGNQPLQFSAPPIPAQPEGVDSLVIVTHGWEPLGPLADISWITDMANAIRTRAPANYWVMPLDWRGAAWFPDPDLALVGGATVGRLYAQQHLSSQHWKHVHLIAHSAGSAVIEAIAQVLKSSANPPVIHETFLDPYSSFISLTGRSVYGANADWADNYSALGGILDFIPRLNELGSSTVGKLEYAYNADVGWVDPKHWTVPFGNGQIALASHGWPHDFYMQTITNIDPDWCPRDFGFPLSKEGGGWDNNPIRFPIGLEPINLCGAQYNADNPSSQPSLIQLTFDALAHAISSGTSLFSSWFTLVSGSSNFLPLAKAAQDGIKPLGSSSDNPGWLAVGIPVTNSVNLVQFDAVFTSSTGAEGLLTVYWNTNEIAMIDERVALPILTTYDFPLPNAVTNGLYTLSFRLDSFNDTLSSITVTNVEMGFVGGKELITLNAMAPDNGLSVVQLTGTSGYNYLLQSSTNLVDWTPSAVLVNTNGSVQFAEPSLTNSGARFFRASSIF